MRRASLVVRRSPRRTPRQKPREGRRQCPGLGPRALPPATTVLSEGAEVGARGFLGGAFRGVGSRVADQHVGAGPAGDRHQPGLGASCGEPAVGCGVAELVGVEARAGELGAPAECPAEIVVAELGSALAEPQLRGVAASVVCSKVQIRAERSAGGGSDGDDAPAASFVAADGSTGRCPVPISQATKRRTASWRMRTLPGAAPP